ncbi:MAG: glycosyltransferase family 4 protein [Lacibacter sp.]
MGYPEIKEVQKMPSTTKIKILECIRQGQIGGGESHLLSLVENMDRNLFEPVVLSFTPGPMVDRLKEMGVETHVIYTERPFDIFKWKKVKNFISDKKFDLVHAHGTRANSNVLWASKKLNVPVIYTIHGWSFHPDQKMFVQKLRIAGEKYLTSKSDINISVSKSNQQSGKSFIRSFQSLIVNNGIDLQKFNPDKSHKNIRAELGISADEILVLFIARFTHHKQPLTLIQAFAKAMKEYPEMHLLMVGDGDQKNQAIQLIQSLGLEKKITLLPFRQDVPDILSSADIYVLPSLWEGLPIGLLEAMSMRKAIIASNVDGTSEIIENNVNGILVETDELIENTAKAMVILCKDKPLRHTFQQKAKETVAERFNASIMTRQIEQIYLDVLKTKQTNKNGI